MTPRNRLILVLLMLLPALVATSSAQEEIRVTIDGQTLTAAELEQVKAKIEAYRKLVPEKDPNEVQASIAKRIDNALGRLSGLGDLMNRLNTADRRLAESATEMAEFERQLKATTAAIENLTLPEAVDEVFVRDKGAEAQSAEQAVKTAEAELQRLAKEEADRAKAFTNLAKRLEDLGAERTTVATAQNAEDLAQERREELNLQLLRIDIETRSVELQRDRHTKLEELDKAATRRAAARLELAKAEKQLADARLAEARKRLEKKLADDQRRALEEAEAKRKEAEREQNPANKARINLEVLVENLKVTKSKELTRRTAWEGRRDGIVSEFERIRAQEQEVESLLPEGEELDQVRANYLRFQLDFLREILPRQQRRLTTLTENVAAVQRDIATERFRIDTFEARLGTEDERRLSSRVEADEQARDPVLAEWTRLRAEWRQAKPAAEAEFPNEFKDWQAGWNAAEANIKTLLGERKKILDPTAAAARESLERSEEIVAMLEKREARLEALAFWLKSDPPFSGIRRDSMSSELAQLADGIAAQSRRTLDELVERIRGVFGILGLACVVLGIGLAVVRRIKSDPTARIEKLVAIDRDPLIEMALVAGWLAFETGHHLLFVLGIGLIWRAPIPEDPFFCAASAFFVVAALRLAAARLVSYLSEASAEVDQILAIEARRFLRFAVFGFFITVPPIFFFARAGAPALSEASRFAATLWALVLVVRLTFRRHLLSLLVPARESSAIGRGLRGLIRWAWPLVVIFVGVIVGLQFQGYQNASLFLVQRTLLAGGFLIVVTIVYQFGQALIESRTTSVIEHAESSEQTQEFMTRARQRQLEAFNRIFTLPLVFFCLIGGVVGVAAIFGLSGARWDEASTASVFKEVRTADGVLIPGLTWGDLSSALLIFVIGYIIASTVRDLIVVGPGKPHDEKRGGQYAIGTLVFYVLMMITIILGLKTMQVSLADYGWLLGTAGVALGFGLTQILSNFVSGLILFVERPVQVGDIVTIGDVQGDVRKISIRSTIVRTRDGVSIILPNRKLIEEDVINWSHSDAKTRLKVDVGVAYGSDVPLVKKILLEVAEREGRILKRPRPEIDFVGFGESELSFRVLAWLATPDITVQRRVRSDMNSAIDAAFRRFGVEIPFPQRDLHIKNTPRTIERKRLDAEAEKEEAEADGSES